jgi:hypothetical protein
MAPTLVWNIMLNERGAVRLPGSPVAGEGMRAISSGLASVMSRGCDRLQLALHRLLALQSLGGLLQPRRSCARSRGAHVADHLAVNDDGREEELVGADSAAWTPCSRPAGR